jgi:hypothetical protein
MKLKALILALCLAAATASVALADDGHGKGKENGSGKGAGGAVTQAAASSTSSTTGSVTTTSAEKEHGKSAEHKGDDAKKAGATCKPSFSLNLHGSVAAAPAGTTVAVLVAKGNGHAKGLAGKQVSVDASGAKVVKKGKKAVADLAVGDRVEVKAKACANADLTKLSIVATQIVVLGAKGKDDDDDRAKTTSTTSTTASTSSTSSTTSTTTPSSTSTTTPVAPTTTR